MSKGKILVVDDSETQNMMYKSFFTKYGYEVFEALNGLEALKKIQEINPDVIVTDLNMPIMNGLDMIKNIKNDEIAKYIPVIVVSSTYQDIESKLRALNEAGADDYFYSPDNLEELVAKIEVMMRIRKVYLELLEKNKQLKIFNDAAIDREMKIIELKKRIEELESKIAELTK